MYTLIFYFLSPNNPSNVKSVRSNVVFTRINVPHYKKSSLWIWPENFLVAFWRYLLIVQVLIWLCCQPDSELISSKFECSTIINIYPGLYVVCLISVFSKNTYPPNWALFERAFSLNVMTSGLELYSSGTYFYLIYGKNRYIVKNSGVIHSYCSSEYSFDQ